MKSKTKKMIAVALIAASIASCTPLAVFRDLPGDRDTSKQVTDSTNVALAKRVGAFAWFAEVVYRKKDAFDCGDLGNQTDRMPSSKGAAWERWKPSNADIDACVEHGSGLFYEVYVLRSGGQLIEAVVAFRGTENTGDQWYRDWFTNITPFLGFRSPQYEVAKTSLEALLPELDQEVSGKIYAVGHSLGGGLAQQAGYISKAVDEVYVFNSSPVTNWSALRWDEAIQREYPVIYRIHHNGEILETARRIATAATSSRFRRTDIAFQFEEKAQFSGHAMVILACNFAQIIHDNPENQSDEAEYHHFKGYASKVLNDPLCAENKTENKTDI